MRLRFHGLRPLGLIAAAVLMIAAGRALATPSLVMDVATGNVLYENEATHPWFPASVTKLMTVYVALSAVRDHQISLDTPLVVSRYAASMPPSKMGFRPGTEVTLGNALKMLMVKSPNDIAITIAEGIAGSVAAFADDMNDAAARLGMKQSHFVNPNGLHNPEHYSSARDLAVLARAIYLTFPQYADLFDIGAMRVDGRIIPQSQRHARPLSRRRRHEDRLHLRCRLQPRRQRDARQSSLSRRRSRRADARRTHRPHRRPARPRLRGG